MCDVMWCDIPLFAKVAMFIQRPVIRLFVGKNKDAMTIPKYYFESNANISKWVPNELFACPFGKPIWAS